MVVMAPHWQGSGRLVALGNRYCTVVVASDKISLRILIKTLKKSCSLELLWTCGGTPTDSLESYFFTFYSTLLPKDYMVCEVSVIQLFHTQRQQLQHGTG